MIDLRPLCKDVSQELTPIILGLGLPEAVHLAHASFRRFTSFAPLNFKRRARKEPQAPAPQEAAVAPGLPYGAIFSATIFSRRRSDEVAARTSRLACHEQR